VFSNVCAPGKPVFKKTFTGKRRSFVKGRISGDIRFSKNLLITKSIVNSRFDGGSPQNRKGSMVNGFRQP
jgi:hypothetical protein